MHKPVFLAAAVLAATCFFAPLAHADDPADTVVLANGGRLRGNVIEYMPKTGMTIRLLDGTTRQLKAAEIARVEYGEDTAPPPAPLAPPAIAVSATTTPAAIAADSKPAPPPQTTQTKSAPAVVAGGIILGLGVVATIGGAVLFAANSGTQDASYTDRNNVGGVATTEHESYVDTGDRTAGEALLVLGGVGVVTGLILVLVGAQRVPVKPSVGLRSVGLTMAF